MNSAANPYKKQLVDEALIEGLFRKYFSSLCIFARQYVYDNDKVRDIVHDVFINIWEKGELYDSDSMVKGYLFTSVKNRCFNYIRDNKKNLTDLDAISFSLSSNNNENKIEFVELKSIIDEAISSLPEKCREVFLLSRNDMLKYQEIADKLEISVKTVEAQMSKALKILREKLSDYTDLILVLLILAILK
ncbi:MAG: RNA polymerase sigma-70 factor [Bacteroidales bacterium]|nr:RNA polymerase sigma-70 factor [Bacteroidales bacterium]